MAMHGFRIDFAMNRGHVMIVDRKKGIYRDELDDIEMNMLCAESVPHLLPVDWFELDGKLTFRYALSGMKMLVHRLQQQPLTMSQYYSLLLSVTDALAECRDYMLRPEGCLLGDSFIFMGERFGDIRLPYIPLKTDVEEQAPGASELLSLAVRWTSYVDHIDGEGLKRIFQLLSASRWPLAELQKTLLDMLGDVKEQSSIPADIGSLPQEMESVNREFDVKTDTSQHSERSTVGGRAIAGGERAKAATLSSPASSEMQLKPVQTSSWSHSDSEIMENVDDEWEEENVSSKASKGKWLIYAVALLATACVWRFIYLPAPSMPGLLSSAGLTLMILAVSVYMGRRGSGLLSTVKDSEEDDGLFEPSTDMLRKKIFWEPNPIHKEGTTHSLGSYSVAGSVRPPKPEMSSESRQTGNIDRHHGNAEPVHSAVLSPAMTIAPTTVLEREDSGELNVPPDEHAAAPVLWLKRKWDGREETIELAGTEPFKIGRAAEGVHYSELAEGVSRVHLEIESKDDEHQAKDLGSRNGSLLNGKLMIPYKTYSLTQGDVIHLAGEKGPSYEINLR
ncbi:DUF6382 domain-containing protein [Paenibacillus chungangensis]|uniref:DUF6382 domain-containing protein n=1 Tax=Paenibacillus chungangensis TaxID=696535 RepID=A0ABW3HUN6_9BACL